MHKVVTLTVNPAVDKSANVADVVPDRKLRCSTPQHEPGGGGINVSRAIRKLGGTSTAVFAAGGPTGAMLDELLDREAIPREHIETEAWTRENLIIFEESTDQQFRFGMPGPRLKESEWQACLARLEAVDTPAYIVASGSLRPGVPDDFYARVSRTAKRLGARLVLDASGAALRRAADEGVYLLKPNAREFTELTGEPFESEAQQERLARGLIENGSCEVLVLSLGAAGALFVTAGHLERVRTPTVPIQSKVGAGDSMVAGIVYALARDWDLRKAICYGTAAGAAATMTPGTELCRSEDVEELHERQMACADT